MNSSDHASSSSVKNSLIGELEGIMIQEERKNKSKRKIPNKIIHAPTEIEKLGVLVQNYIAERTENRHRNIEICPPLLQDN